MISLMLTKNDPIVHRPIWRLRDDANGLEHDSDTRNVVGRTYVEHCSKNSSVLL
jgi:hypothetical protein